MNEQLGCVLGIVIWFDLYMKWYILWVFIYTTSFYVIAFIHELQSRGFFVGLAWVMLSPTIMAFLLSGCLRKDGGIIIFQALLSSRLTLWALYCEHYYWRNWVIQWMRYKIGKERSGGGFCIMIPLLITYYCFL